jgi:hypothetical protein
MGQVSHRSASVRGSLCFNPHRIPKLRAATLHRIAELADDIRSSEPRIDRLSPFGAGVRRGIAAGPSVWFGDTAEIPLLGRKPGKRFDYRLAWLAKDNDVVITGGLRCETFESYQRRWLGAPKLRYLNVDPEPVAPRRATPTICLRDQETFDLLCGELAGQRSVTLHAHMTTGTIWALAGRLNQTIGADVCVAGPPPLLSRRANDKLWFGEVARRLIGSGAVPPKRAAYSSSALTRHVAELAREWDRLVIKVPDSAGSAGNFPLASEDIRGLSPIALKRRLMQILSAGDGAPAFPMLVEVWDANVLTSPSVQTWIPDPADGPPLVETIFEQVLHGEGSAFAGAHPTVLPPAVSSELMSGAFQLATLFQQMGYFGRCSFDAIVTGAEIDSGTVHWIECNARWGGASIPMSLVHRLAAKSGTPHYAIVQSDRNGFRALDFTEVLREFADLELSPDLQSGVLFLSPTVTQTGQGCHFLAFGSDDAVAAKLAQSTLQRLRSP